MDSGKDLIRLLSDTPKVLNTIYSDLAQPGVKKVGIALETVLEFSTSFLLPIKLLNQKFKLNFEKRINEYKEKLNDTPIEDLCSVNPQIGAPIIDKLSYTTNEEIADLFTSLLAKASSMKTANLAHPSFVQLIERLSVDEARIIKFLLNKDFIPYISLRAHSQKIGFDTLLKFATTLPFEVNLIFPNNTNMYLDNFVSMGILDISHGFHKIDKTIYEPLYKLYECERIEKAFFNKGIYRNVEKINSYYQITDFGKSFIKACNHVTKK